MRRATAALAVGLVSVSLLTGCSKSEEKRCIENYKRSQQQLTGITPSNAQAKSACSRESTRSYYGGSAVRGGGSGSGK